MESQKGTDFYYNMHKTAKLVAMLLDKFNLTTNDVKMHNYFSGKNCAQLLKNNLKYQYNYQIDKHDMEDTSWDEFLDLCDTELQMLRYSKNYKFEFVSGDTSMIDNTGRVINHKVTRECVAYKIIITDLATNEKTELNSSIIIPSSLEIDPDYITKR
jgi:N-acetylmuramoyl-L-alanine amidase CwlA